MDAVTQQVKVYRAMLPVLLRRLSKISDPRNPRKTKHKLTVLMIYGILCFAFQMSSRREANREMTRPVFEANLRRLFPDLDELPHQDTLVLLDGLYPNGPIIELCRQNHWDFMIVLQDTSLSTVWEEIQGRKQLERQKLEPPKVWSQNWGNRRQRFQWFNDIE